MVNLVYIPFLVTLESIVSNIKDTQQKREKKNLIKKRHVIILPAKVAGGFSILPATANFYPHLA